MCLTKYTGLDGSETPYADKIVDLEAYQSHSPGILVRHVLEHNYNWEQVLKNAIASFGKKMCLCLFTPFETSTREIAHNRTSGVDVPDLSFARSDIEQHLVGVHWTLFDNIQTDTQYKVEHVYLIWR